MEFQWIVNVLCNENLPESQEWLGRIFTEKWWVFHIVAVVGMIVYGAYIDWDIRRKGSS